MKLLVFYKMGQQSTPPMADESESSLDVNGDIVGAIYQHRTEECLADGWLDPSRSVDNITYHACKVSKSEEEVNKAKQISCHHYGVSQRLGW